MKTFAALLAVTLLVVLTIPQTGDGQKPPAIPSVDGVLVGMTKDKDKDQGTITIAIGGKQTAYEVTEKTRFEFKRGNDTIRTNFLAEHQGLKVAVFSRLQGNPPFASKVQILLPPPPPPPPAPTKPTWVNGTVAKVDGNNVVLKLANHTPPPPRRGTVTNVGVNSANSTGTITIQSGGKQTTFVVNPATYFQKIVNKAHVPVTFLSIHMGEDVEIFPRYGAPHSASKVDVLLKGAKAEAAIVHKDHFLHFHANPATHVEVVREGKHHASNLKALAVGENVGILPDHIHSHTAGKIHIHAPHAIHGVLASASASGMSVKVHSKTKGDHIVPVAIGAGAKLMIVEGKNHKPATHADLKPSVHLTILPAIAPPFAAEIVEIHHRHIKPRSFHGAVLTASAGAMSVKTDGKDGVRQFSLNPKTHLEAHEGKNRRPASLADFRPGAKVTVLAGGDHHEIAMRVEIEAHKTPAKKTTPIKISTPKLPTLKK